MARSYYSTVLNVPAQQLWEVLRDFNGLATWFRPAVTHSHIEDGLTGTTVGAVRCFQLGQQRIRERLLALSEVTRSYSYEFVEPAPFPVTGYLATLRVTPVTESTQSLVEWWTDFDAPAGDAQHWIGFFAAEVFAPALAALRTYCEDHFGHATSG